MKKFDIEGTRAHYWGMKKLPEVLYISVEEEGTEDEFVQASLSVNDVPMVIGETRKVGIYKLSRVVSATAEVIVK